MKNNTFNTIKHWDQNLMYKFVSKELDTIYECFDKHNIKSLSFVDIGSNVGKFYDEISKKYQINKCVMVEASSLLSEYSKEKFKENSNVFIHNVGLSDTNGDFYFDDAGVRCLDENNIDATGQEINLGLSGKTNFPGTTKFYNASYFLENLCEIEPENIDFIKIDTENQDFPIILAMSEFLIKNKKSPIILFENNFHNTNMTLEEAQSAINDFCFKCGYNTVDLRSGENIILTKNTNL